MPKSKFIIFPILAIISSIIIKLIINLPSDENDKKFVSVSYLVKQNEITNKALEEAFVRQVETHNIAGIVEIFNKSQEHNVIMTSVLLKAFDAVDAIANLILIDNNPLLDLSALQNPTSVFIKGRKLNRDSLDGFEEKARNRKNLIASAVRYLENLMFEK